MNIYCFEEMLKCGQKLYNVRFRDLVNDFNEESCLFQNDNMSFNELILRVLDVLHLYERLERAFWLVK